MTSEPANVRDIFKHPLSPSPSPADGPLVVRIGCCPIPLQRLQSFLGALHLKAPCIETEVLHLETAAQLSRLRSDELDLGVIDYAAPPPPLRVQPLYAGERIAAVLPRTHRLSARPTVRPGDLAGETLLSPPRSTNVAFHDKLDAALAAAGHRVRLRRETRGVHAHDVLLAVAEGHGIALTPLSTLRHAGELGAVLTGRLLDPSVHLPDTMLAWRADPPPALVDAITAARAVARELHGYSSQS